MKSFLKKAPTLIVIGVTGFVAYTVLFPEGDPGSPKTEAKPPPTDKVETSIVAGSLRNPFLMDRRVETDPGSTALATSDPAKASAPAKIEKPNELPALPAEDDSVLESMKLVGTFVDSREQLAIIDNKVYSRGDRLRGTDGATLPYVVTEVRKDRALVRRGRRDFVIAFSDAPRSAAPRAVSPPTPAAEKTLTRADGGTKFIPIEKSKKGRTAVAGQPDGNDANDQKALLLQLLSTLGGAQGGGGGSTGANPLAGLGSGSGLNSNALNSMVNPTTLGAGLDAIMGKGDNIGQGGATGP